MRELSQVAAVTGRGRPTIAGLGAFAAVIDELGCFALIDAETDELLARQVTGSAHGLSDLMRQEWIGRQQSTHREHDR
jgi:hypothetical protein